MKFLSIIFILFSLCFGKVLIPLNDVNSENLKINGKERIYFRLEKNEYLVSGPSTVTIFSRGAFPKKNSGEYELKISTLLKGFEQIDRVKSASKKKDKNVTSTLHPMHAYTESSKTVIDIPKGEFRLQVTNRSHWNLPVFSRVIQKRNRK